MKVFAVLFVLLAQSACGKSVIDDDPSGPVTQAPPASQAQVDALGGLRDGDTLGPARVIRVAEIYRGMMPVEVEVAGARSTLTVCLFSEQGPAPPVRTERYAIYWGSGSPGTKSVPNDALMATTEALAARIRKVEATVTPPKGVTQYVMEKKP